MPANGGTPTANSARYGAKVLKRGFPRTHHFAQARSVFAVAAHRCDQIFDPLGCVTFWRLTDATEDEFDRRWEAWLDDAGKVGTVLRGTGRNCRPDGSGPAQAFRSRHGQGGRSVGFVEAIDRRKGDPNSGRLHLRSTDGRPAGAGIRKIRQGRACHSLRQGGDRYRAVDQGRTPPPDAPTEDA